MISPHRLSDSTAANTICIIIVNWNGKDFLGKCLDALFRQSYDAITITVVDNGSTDGSAAFLAAEYPEVNLIALPDNRGFALGNNIVLKNVGSDYVALINNDAVAHPLWLRNLVAALEKHPEAGFAASRMLFYDQPDVIDRAGDAYTVAGTGLLRGRGMASKAYGKTEWMFGACAGAALYRTDMLEKIGFFDEDFFLLYEDVDLSFRAQLQGYRCLYVPEAVVYHKGSASIVYDSPVSVYYSHRNLEWVYLKNMPLALIPVTFFPHLVYNLAAFFYFAVNGRGADFIRAKIDALKEIPKMLKKRRDIQQKRRVSSRYIWSILEGERFFPRVIRRLGKF